MPGYARNPDAIADDVLVFPNEETRAIAFPYPMPSQISYLEDTKIIQYWDGSLWRSVGGGGGGGVGNTDGGFSNSVYGGIAAIDGGGAS